MMAAAGFATGMHQFMWDVTSTWNRNIDLLTYDSKDDMPYTVIQFERFRFTSCYLLASEVSALRSALPRARDRWLTGWGTPLTGVGSSSATPIGLL